MPPWRLAIVALLPALVFLAVMVVLRLARRAARPTPMRVHLVLTHGSIPAVEAALSLAPHGMKLWSLRTLEPGRYLHASYLSANDLRDYIRARTEQPTMAIVVVEIDHERWLSRELDRLS